VRTSGILLVSRDVVSSDGQKAHTDQVVVFDGKDYPSVPFPGAMQACTRISDYSFVCVHKRDGKEMLKIYDIVFSDGRTGTLIFTGRNSQGKEFLATFVYDKQ
jgi:hypothetical protein